MLQETIIENVKTIQNILIFKSCNSALLNTTTKNQYMTFNCSFTRKPLLPSSSTDIDPFKINGLKSLIV